jgi:hypothetical protein
MTSRRRRVPPIPFQPTHRRSWRTLWRHCTCGLAAPCVDRLVPATQLPYPPRPVGGAVGTAGRRAGARNAESPDAGRQLMDVQDAARRRDDATATQAGRAADLTPGQAHRADLVCHTDGHRADGTTGHPGYPGRPGHRQVQPEHR